MKLDKYYASLLEQTDMESVVAAGWFDEAHPVPIEESLEFYTTPLDAITLSDENEVAVLYYTGCFSPIHEGHLTAMRLAKETVEQATGLPVVAGYFAPDHDSYAGTKSGNDPAYAAARRVAFIQEQTMDEEWMQVDVWPALYAPADMNFTFLYERFERYIQKWIPTKKVRLYCVFGSDNYLFANAFTKFGNSVCVPRKGVSMDRSRILPTASVLWADKESTDDSSTKIRADRAKAQLLAEKESEDEVYVLREDLALAFPKPLGTLNNPDLTRTIKTALEERTGRIVQTENVLEQLEDFTSSTPFISLDCFLPAEHKLELTRVFVAGDTQKYSKLHTNRTGTPSLEEQVAVIPVGVYDLVDDDIATGTTMHTVATLLNQHGIRAGEFRCFLEHYEGNIFDILDMRDFVLGAKHGGLTVRTISGEITRLLYAAPYVNLVTRAKLDPVEALRFSAKVWEMNRQLYRGSSVTVGSISEFQNYTLLGFDESMTLEELCSHHLRMLEGQTH